MELEKQMPGKPLFAGPFRNDGTRIGLCSPGSAAGISPTQPILFTDPSDDSSIPGTCPLSKFVFFLFLFLAPHSMWGLNFSDQGWNPYPLQCKHGILNHCTAREFPLCSVSWTLPCLLCPGMHGLCVCPQDPLVTQGPESPLAWDKEVWRG